MNTVLSRDTVRNTEGWSRGMRREAASVRSIPSPAPLQPSTQGSRTMKKITRLKKRRLRESTPSTTSSRVSAASMRSAAVFTSGAAVAVAGSARRVSV